MTLSSEEITEIYEAARTLLPAARAVARRARVASHSSEDLLMEVAVRVIELRQRQGGESEIENLPSYIWTAFKRLLSLHIRKASSEQNLTDKGWDHLPGRTDAFQEITRLILVEEIIKQLDEQTSFIFEKRLLDYSFEEIAVEYQEAFGKRIRANALRNMYYRAVTKLSRELSGM